MNRRLIGLLSAIGLAAVGTLLLVGYVNTAEARATEGEKLVDVLVVSQPIEAGTPAEDITSEVRTEQVPAKVQAQDAVSDLKSLHGLVAAVDLVPGEQLVKSRFVTPQVQKRGDVPAGLLQVTVSLDPARALGGQIAQGDLVGVIASFDDAGNGQPASHLILHKVLVTSVQAAAPVDAKDEKAAPTSNLLVTLAVDAPAAERIVFAAEHGRVWLTAEPQDANEGGTRVQSKATVFG
ncbi:MAG: pilus assembly protein CpaB [Actinomycetota bacterium]|jgi:pilus assembly protein CpaB|nr:pilus assembly protein CpaB [Actinomycetota bacterium]